MALPEYALNEDGVPVTRIYWHHTEATAALIAGADGGRAHADIAVLAYASPGRSGQAWRAAGVDTAAHRIDASLVSASGPWTNISAGSLADPAPAGTARTLYLRDVALRWAPDPTAVITDDWSLSLGVVGVAGREIGAAAGAGGAGSPIGLLLALTEA